MLAVQLWFGADALQDLVAYISLNRVPSGTKCNTHEAEILYIDLHHRVTIGEGSRSVEGSEGLGQFSYDAQAPDARTQASHPGNYTAVAFPRYIPAFRAQAYHKYRGQRKRQAAGAGYASDSGIKSSGTVPSFKAVTQSSTFCSVDTIASIAANSAAGSGS